MNFTVKTPQINLSVLIPTNFISMFSPVPETPYWYRNLKLNDRLILSKL